MSNYSAADVQVLQGLNPIRERPGMYIGNKGKGGFHHCLWEVVDNSVDEAQAGYCDEISVTLNPDNSVTVLDNGRGIPVDNKTIEGVTKPAVEWLFTELHAGGKFDGKGAYGYSGGLHGIGVKAVNALSDHVDVEIYRNGKSYEINFHSIREAHDDGTVTVHPGVVKEGLRTTGKVEKGVTGTKVEFLLDTHGFFDVSTWDMKAITSHLSAAAQLNPGLTITLTDNRDPEAPTEEVFYFENGLSSLVEEIGINRAGVEEEDEDGEINVYWTPLLDEEVYLEGVATAKGKDGEEVGDWRLHIQWVDDGKDTILSYANSIPTRNGGFHVSVIRSVLVRNLNRYGKQIGVLDDGPRLEWADISSGIILALAVRVKQASFEGQTKGKLNSVDGQDKDFERSMNREVSSWIESNPQRAKVIVDQAAYEMSLRHRQAEEAKRERDGREPTGYAPEDAKIPSKLSDCEEHGPNSELFVVEGDSAGGGAKKKKIHRFQAVLPIRGKMTNLYAKKNDKTVAVTDPVTGVERVVAKITQNAEIFSLISALGTGSEDNFDMSKANYGRIMLMTDADSDGSHIRLLLVGILNKLVPQLLTEGMVYYVDTPLYMGTKGSKKFFAWNMQEREEISASTSGIIWDRFKGLGQLNRDQIFEHCLNPATRRVKQLTVTEEEIPALERVLHDTLGDNPARKLELLKEMQETGGPSESLVEEYLGECDPWYGVEDPEELDEDPDEEYEEDFQDEGEDE